MAVARWLDCALRCWRWYLPSQQQAHTPAAAPLPSLCSTPDGAFVLCHDLLTIHLAANDAPYTGTVEINPRDLMAREASIIGVKAGAFTADETAAAVEHICAGRCRQSWGAPLKRATVAPQARHRRT